MYLHIGRSSCLRRVSPSSFGNQDMVVVVLWLASLVAPLSVRDSACVIVLVPYRHDAPSLASVLVHLCL